MGVVYIIVGVVFCLVAAAALFFGIITRTERKKGREGGHSNHITAGIAAGLDAFAGLFELACFLVSFLALALASHLFGLW